MEAYIVLCEKFSGGSEARLILIGTALLLNPGQQRSVGLGFNATAVTPSNPFFTLWWAVTGKMIGGKQVLKLTITREEALIAHTRANAPFYSKRAIK